MKFSDTSAQKDGLLQACEFKLFGNNSYGTITGSPDKLATFTRLLNRALDRVTVILMNSDGRWKNDDTTYTDYSIATADLVSGQQDYPLAVEHIKILRVECKDNNGDWVKLTPIDEKDVQTALPEFLDDNAIPMYYDKVANSVFLYPATNYASSLGLRVYYQRPPNYFVTTDTTKVPGFASTFHDILVSIACFEYAKDQTLANRNDFALEVKEKEQSIKMFYLQRDQDDTPALTRLKRNYK